MYINIFIHIVYFTFMCIICIYINIYIYVIMKTMCPPGYHHNGFVATHALGHVCVYTYICVYTLHNGSIQVKPE